MGRPEPLTCANLVQDVFQDDTLYIGVDSGNVFGVSSASGHGMDFVLLIILFLEQFFHVSQNTFVIIVRSLPASKWTIDGREMFFERTSSALDFLFQKILFVQKQNDFLLFEIDSSRNGFEQIQTFFQAVGSSIFFKDLVILRDSR